MEDEFEEDVEELSESLSATAVERHRWRAFLGRLDPALLAPGTPLGPTPPLEAVRLGLDLVVLRLLLGTAGVLVASQTSSRSSRRLSRSSPSVEQSVSGSEYPLEPSREDFLQRLRWPVETERKKTQNWHKRQGIP